MIAFNYIKEWLLIKAINLHKDRSKLVLIERMVTKRGKTFRQKFWILPDKVEKTDRVLLNHHNLPKGHPKRPKNVANPKSKKTYDHEVQLKVEKFFQQFPYHEDLYRVLNLQGIEWERSADDAVMFDRATRAASAAVHNGYKLINPLNQKISPIHFVPTYTTLNLTTNFFPTIEDFKKRIEGYKTLSVTDQDWSDLPDSQLLEGITTDAKSDLERQKFGEELKAATAKELHIYRSTGILGRDQQATNFLQKTLIMQGLQKLDTQDSTKFDFEYVRDIQNKVLLKLGLNASVTSLSRVNSVYSKSITDFSLEDSYQLFKKWHNPYEYDWDKTSQARQQRTKKEYDVLYADDWKVGSEERYNRAIYAEGSVEPIGEFGLLRERLEQLKQHPEYKEIAKEFSQNFEHMMKIANNEPAVIACDTNEMDFKGVESALSATSAEELIKRYSDDLAKASTVKGKTGKRDVEYYTKKVAEIQEHKEVIDQFLKARNALIDPKYKDILHNLAVLQNVSKAMGESWREIPKPITQDLPILSPQDFKYSKYLNQTYNGTNKPQYLSRTRAYFQSIPLIMSYNPECDKHSLAELAKAYNEVLDEDVINNRITLEGENSAYDVFDKSQIITEDREVISSIKSVSPEIHAKLSQQVLDDWDTHMHGNKSRLTIRGIYEVADMEMEKDFENIKSKNNDYANVTSCGKNCQVDEFYHGTDYNGMLGILGVTGHFLPSSGGMFGVGTYLADVSSKSAQYAGKGYSHGQRTGALFIVDASIGNTEVVQPNKAQSDYNKYDTVCGKKGVSDVKNNEWATHDEKGVKPKYIIDIDVAGK